jgi:hypothetical protein
LTLVVVEVCGNRDHGLLNLLAELDLSNLLHLLESVNMKWPALVEPRDLPW